MARPHEQLALDAPEAVALSAPARAPARTPATSPQIEVRRSARRKRTVSAYRDGDRTVVLIPGRMSRADERRWVEIMVERLAAGERKRRPGDDALLERARSLSVRYLGGAAQPDSVRWVSNQGSRWGSCTPTDRTIRLSDRLQGMPAWVVDYVLVHELAHLLERTHSARFHELVAAYPRTERATGYLEGVAATARLTGGWSPEPADAPRAVEGADASAGAHAPTVGSPAHDRR